MSKRVQRILCLFSVALVLLGCGSSTQMPADSNSNVSISESETENESTGTAGLDYATENISKQEEAFDNDVSNSESLNISETAWIETYISYLKELDTFSYPQGGFIYLDDDDIPEIALEGNVHADGSMILAIGSDNSVKENGFAENHVYYVPRGGAVFDFRPGGGGVSEGVSVLKDKEWEDLFRGEFICDHYPDSDYYKDFEGDNYEVYEGGTFEIGKEKSVSEEEYYSMLQEAFDKCGFDDTKAKNTKDDIKFTAFELIEELEKQLPGGITSKAKADEHLIAYLKGKETDANGEPFWALGQDNVEYALYDLDGDNINELIVRTNGDWIYDIVQYKDEKIQLANVANQGSAGRTFINTNNQFVSEDKHEGRTIYAISEIYKDGSTRIAMLLANYSGDWAESGSPEYYQRYNPSRVDIKMDEQDSITKEEFDSFVNQYTQENIAIKWEKITY